MVTTALCSLGMRQALWPDVSSRLTTSLPSLGSRSPSNSGTQPSHLSRAFHPSPPKPAGGSYAKRPNRVVHVRRLPLPAPSIPQRPTRVVHVGPRPAYVPLPAAWHTEPTPSYPRRPSPSPSSLSTFTLPNASPRPSLPTVTQGTPSPHAPHVLPRPSPFAYTPVSLPSYLSPYILPDVPDTQFLMPDIYGDLPAGIIWPSSRSPAPQSSRTPAPTSALSPIRQPADYTFIPSPGSAALSSPDTWEDDGWVPPPETWPVCPRSLSPHSTTSPLISCFSAPEPPGSPSGISWITSSRQSSLNIHTLKCSLCSLWSCLDRASPPRTSAPPPRTPAAPISSFAYSSGDDRSLLARVADAFTLSLSWLSHSLSTGISIFFGAHD